MLPYLDRALFLAIHATIRLHYYIMNTEHIIIFARATALVFFLLLLVAQATTLVLLLLLLVARATLLL
jgi:hypothetical protein